MFKVILRRLIILIPQLIFISMMIFLLSELMPGDAFAHLIEDPDVSEETIMALREAAGLNDPLPVRYGRWLHGVVTRFDFGVSLSHRRDAIEIIGERATNTAILGTLTLALTYIISIPLGIIAGRKSGKWSDKTILLYSFITLAIPTIVMSIVVLFVFGFTLGWIPIRGSVSVMEVSGTFGYFTSRIHHLLGPALTGAVLGGTFVVFFLRNEIVDTQNSDYVTTARAKGVPERVVYNKHILRNSILPIVPGIGGALAAILTGSIFIEQMFSFPGMGGLFLTAIGQRDFPIILAISTIFSVLIALGVLLGDILLVVVDPRIRIK